MSKLTQTFFMLFPGAKLKASSRSKLFTFKRGSPLWDWLLPPSAPHVAQLLLWRQNRSGAMVGRRKEDLTVGVWWVWLCKTFAESEVSRGGWWGGGGGGGGTGKEKARWASLGVWRVEAELMFLCISVSWSDPRRTVSNCLLKVLINAIFNWTPNFLWRWWWV